MADRERDYDKEYKQYHGTEEQRKRRAARNKARRHLEKEGRVRKHDGKDVERERAKSDSFLLAPKKKH